MCDVLWWMDVGGQLSTDGDAADAGRLDARHVVALVGAQSRRMAGAASWALGLVRSHRTYCRRYTRARCRYSARTKYTVRSGHGVWPSTLVAIWSGTERSAAAGGGRQRARAPGIRLWQGAGPRPAHKSNFAHSHGYTGSPPPYSIFGAGHIFIIITPHIHKRHVIASKLTARGGRRPVGGADAR